MSITVSIYDFFAYTIPGGVYLFAIIYACATFGIVTIDYQSLNSLSATQITAGAILAYILGLLLDQFAKYWYRLFKPKNVAQAVLDGLKVKHPEVDMKFRGKDWAVLIAYLRRERADAALDIERLNASHIMLKNVSFGLVILSIIQLAQTIQMNFPVWSLILCAALVVASVIAGRQAAKFNKWFYSANYEAIIARGIDISDLIVRKQEKAIPPVKKTEEAPSE